MDESKDSTIVLDSSLEEDEAPSRAFQPVKPGGKLLHDETIDLSSSDDSQHEVSQQEVSQQEVSQQDVSQQDVSQQEVSQQEVSQQEVSQQDVSQQDVSQSEHEESPAKQHMDSRYVTSVQSPPAASSTHLSFHTPALHSSAIEDDPSRNDPFALQDEFCQEGEGTLASTPQRKINSTPDGGRDSGLPAEEEEEVEDEQATLLQASGDAPPPRSQPLEESDLPKTCTVLRGQNGGILYLVGTAHFSKESCDDVKQVVAKAKPDAVLLELCAGRVDILRLDEETLLRESQGMDMSRMMATLRSHGTVQGVMYLLMLSLSAKLTRELGMAPGGEFRAAVSGARQVDGCQVQLTDRPIQITMKRALAALSPWQKVKLGWNILTSNDTITKEEVEKCKNKDILEGMLEDLAGEFPAMTKVFVDERDIYLAHTMRVVLEDPRHPAHAGRLRTGHVREPPVVVGVVGIGHVKGIVERWGSTTDAEAARVCVVPPPSRAAAAVRYGVRLSLLSLAAYAGYRLARGPGRSVVAAISASVTAATR